MWRSFIHFLYPFLLRSGSQGLLESVPAVFGGEDRVKARTSLSQAHTKRQTRVCTRIYSSGQSESANVPHMQVFGLWEETVLRWGDSAKQQQQQQHVLTLRAHYYELLILECFTTPLELHEYSISVISFLLLSPTASSYHQLMLHTVSIIPAKRRQTLKMQQEWGKCQHIKTGHGQTMNNKAIPHCTLWHYLSGKEAKITRLRPSSADV